MRDGGEAGEAGHDRLRDADARDAADGLHVLAQTGHASLDVADAVSVKVRSRTRRAAVGVVDLAAAERRGEAFRPVVVMMRYEIRRQSDENRRGAQHAPDETLPHWPRSIVDPARPEQDVDAFVAQQMCAESGGKAGADREANVGVVMGAGADLTRRERGRRASCHRSHACGGHDRNRTPLPFGHDSERRGHDRRRPGGIAFTAAGLLHPACAAVIHVTSELLFILNFSHPLCCGRRLRPV